MEGDAYFPMAKEVDKKGISEWLWSIAACTWAKGVDKKDISESADKVEFRIHWVDADHFDLGSTSFSRVKLPK